jgi:L-histidine N-alpha-methyltransferase
MKQEVRQGLTADQKYIPSKYFYDSRGSNLFERICEQPEYYQTRTELAILKKSARQIMRDLKTGNLVELGSGANWKVRHLLDAAGSRGKIRYVPVDVCESALVGSAEELLCLYPELSISGIVADFQREMDRIGLDGDSLITFFGGTIGNFTAEEGQQFLTSLAGAMGRRDRLLLGVDMVKRKDVLEAAYNDEQGVTAQFNRNILAVLNRELNADFNTSAFEHLAFYNSGTESIEMHLRASDDLTVEVAGLDLHLEMQRGETVFTEISRKFRRETIEAMAREAGLGIMNWYTDRKEWFSLVEMKKR